MPVLQIEITDVRLQDAVQNHAAAGKGVGQSVVDLVEGQPYDLKIESQKYQYFLKGSEQNRRRLIGHLATRDVCGFFSSKTELEQLFPGHDIQGVMQKLYNTCQQAYLFLNDFIRMPKKYFTMAGWIAVISALKDDL